jgi:hypothetical protein
VWKRFPPNFAQRSSPNLAATNVHLANTSLLASLLECPGSMQGAEGGTPLLPTRNSDGRSAVRRRILGFVMLMMLVGMSARLAFTGIEILK